MSLSDYECPCWTKAHCRYHDAKSPDHAPCCQIAVDNAALDRGRLVVERDALKRHYDAAAPEHNLLALLDLYEERERQATAERDRLAAELQAIRTDRDQWAAVASKVNDAIGRAGIHCALFYWEAIDQLAAQRDRMKPVYEAALKWAPMWRRNVRQTEMRSPDVMYVRFPEEAIALADAIDHAISTAKEEADE
jgi:hypothetical protein